VEKVVRRARVEKVAKRGKAARRGEYIINTNVMGRVENWT